MKMDDSGVTQTSNIMNFFQRTKTPIAKDLIASNSETTSEKLSSTETKAVNAVNDDLMHSSKRKRMSKESNEGKSTSHGDFETEVSKKNKSNESNEGKTTSHGDFKTEVSKKNKSDESNEGKTTSHGDFKTEVSKTYVVDDIDCMVQASHNASTERESDDFKRDELAQNKPKSKWSFAWKGKSRKAKTIDDCLESDSVRMQDSSEIVVSENSCEEIGVVTCKVSKCDSLYVTDISKSVSSIKSSTKIGNVFNTKPESQTICNPSFSDSLYNETNSNSGKMSTDDLSQSSSISIESTSKRPCVENSEKDASSKFKMAADTLKDEKKKAKRNYFDVLMSSSKEKAFDKQKSVESEKSEDVCSIENVKKTEMNRTRKNNQKTGKTSKKRQDGADFVDVDEIEDELDLFREENKRNKTRTTKRKTKNSVVDIVCEVAENESALFTEGDKQTKKGKAFKKKKTAFSSNDIGETEEHKFIEEDNKQSRKGETAKKNRKSSVSEDTGNYVSDEAAEENSTLNKKGKILKRDMNAFVVDSDSMRKDVNKLIEIGEISSRNRSASVDDAVGEVEREESALLCEEKRQNKLRKISKKNKNDFLVDDEPASFKEGKIQEKSKSKGSKLDKSETKDSALKTRMNDLKLRKSNAKEKPARRFSLRRRTSSSFDEVLLESEQKETIDFESTQGSSTRLARNTAGLKCDKTTLSGKGNEEQSAAVFSRVIEEANQQQEVPAAPEGCVNDKMVGESVRSGAEAEGGEKYCKESPPRKRTRRSSKRLRKQCILDSDDEEETIKFQEETKSPSVETPKSKKVSTGAIAPIFLPGAWRRAKAKLEEAERLEAKLHVAEVESDSISLLTSESSGVIAVEEKESTFKPSINEHSTTRNDVNTSMAAFLGAFQKPSPKPVTVVVEFVEAPFPRISHVRQQDDGIKWKLPMICNRFVKELYFISSDLDGSVLERSSFSPILRTAITASEEESAVKTKAAKLNVKFELDKSQKQRIVLYLKTIYKGVPMNKLFKRCQHQLEMCEKSEAATVDVNASIPKISGFRQSKGKTTSVVANSGSSASFREKSLPFTRISSKKNTPKVKDKKITKKESPLLLAFKNQENISSNTKEDVSITKSTKKGSKSKSKKNCVGVKLKKGVNKAKLKSLGKVNSKKETVPGKLKGPTKKTSIMDFVSTQSKEYETEVENRLRKSRRSKRSITTYTDENKTLLDKSVVEIKISKCKKRERESENENSKGCVAEESLQPTVKKAKLLSSNQHFKKPRKSQKRILQTEESTAAIEVEDDEAKSLAKPSNCRKISSDEDFVKPKRTRHVQEKIQSNFDGTDSGVKLGCAVAKQSGDESKCLRKSRRLQEQSTRTDNQAEIKISIVESCEGGSGMLTEEDKEYVEKKEGIKENEGDVKVVEDTALEAHRDELATPGEMVEQRSLNKEDTTPELSSASSSVLWSECFKPRSSSEILGNTNAGNRLRNWLSEWKTLRERKLQALQRREEKKQKRLAKKKSNNETSSNWWHDDDSDFDSSDGSSDDGSFYDEDDVCNMMLISGQVGCGKTSAVYACAEELGFKVIEVNSSTKRGGKYILSELLEATQSHQVSTKNLMSLGKCSLFSQVNSIVSEATQKDKKKSRKSKNDSKLTNKARSKKKENKVKDYQPSAQMSLILLDEVDVLFEEDKGFWVSVNTLRQNSKRPIIMTASDPSAVEIDGELQHITLKSPSLKLNAAYLQTICLTKNVFVNPTDIRTLALLHQGNIRRLVLGLQFWVDSDAGACGQHGIVVSSHFDETLSTVTGDNADRVSSNPRGSELCNNRSEMVNKIMGTDNSVSAHVVCNGQKKVCIGIVDSAANLSGCNDAESSRPTEVGQLFEKQVDSNEGANELKNPTDSCIEIGKFSSDDTTGSMSAAQFFERDSEKEFISTESTVEFENTVSNCIDIRGSINQDGTESTNIINACQVSENEQLCSPESAADIKKTTNCESSDLVSQNSIGLSSVKKVCQISESPVSGTESRAELLDGRSSCIDSGSSVNHELGESSAVLLESTLKERRFENQKEVEMHRLGLESLLGLRNVNNRMACILEALKPHLDARPESFVQKCLLASHCQGLGIDTVYCNLEALFPCVLNEIENLGAKNCSSKREDQLAPQTLKSCNTGVEIEDSGGKVSVRDNIATVEPVESCVDLGDKITEEDRVSKKLAEISLECLAHFYEDMSFMDSELRADSIATKTPRKTFGSWSAKISPGVKDSVTKMSRSCTTWRSTCLKNELRGAVEIASLENSHKRFHGLYDDNAEKFAKYASKLMNGCCGSLRDQGNVGGMDESGRFKNSTRLAECSEVLNRKISTTMLNDESSCFKVTSIPENFASEMKRREQEYNTVLPYLPELNHLNRDSVVMDFLATLRTICRSESERRAARLKRRFYHYFDSIGLHIPSPAVQFLAEDDHFTV